MKTHQITLSGSIGQPRPNPHLAGDRATLAAIARRAMIERNLEPDFPPPVEGRLESGFQGLDVGDRVHVKLFQTDVERGFIDLARA